VLNSKSVQSGVVAGREFERANMCLSVCGELANQGFSADKTYCPSDVVLRKSFCVLQDGLRREKIDREGGQCMSGAESALLPLP